MKKKMLKNEHFVFVTSEYQSGGRDDVEATLNSH